MKTKLTGLAALTGIHATAFVHAGGEGWSSDFAAAQKEAAESNKDLRIDFKARIAAAKAKEGGAEDKEPAAE